MEEHDVFDERKDFHDGRAIRSIYRVNDYFDPPCPKLLSTQGIFFIDKNNSELIGPYSWTQSFSSGIAPVILPTKDPKEQVVSLIDQSGKVIGQTNLQANPSREKPAFAKIGPFREGLAAVLTIPEQNSAGKLTAKWGFIDGTGQWVLKPQFETASDFSNGVACVRGEFDGDAITLQEKPKTWGYINREGKFVIPPVYMHASPFSEKLAFVRHLYHIETNADDSNEVDVRVVYSAIDIQGKVQFSNPDAEFALPYSDGLALIPGKASYMDATGRIVIDGKEFLEARSFSNGLACVKHAKTGRYGFIDKLGHLVIPANFERAGDFCEGMAPVLVNKLWGFIDKSGQMVIPARYLSVRPFSDGLAAAITRKFSRHEFRREVQRCLFDLVDPSTNEVRAQCNLVQLPGKKRVLISSVVTCIKKGGAGCDDIVSEKGYAALRDAGGTRELQMRGRPAIGIPATNYGKVKLLKLIPTANLAVYEPPEGLTREGLTISSVIPTPTGSFGDAEQNQLVLNCGIGSQECFISGAREELLDVKLRPTARGGRTVGGEALLNSNGELVGIAVKYELAGSTLAIQCLPSTTILRHLCSIPR